MARILGLPYAGESEQTTGAVPPASAGGGPLVVPADFELEGTMSIQDVAAALKTNTGAVIEKLGLPSTIPLDKPLRDLRDTYGFSMPDLKELIRK